MIELNVLSGDVVDLNVNDNSPTTLEVNMATSGGGGGQLSDDVKQALLQIAENVAYINDQGQVYYNDLYNALYPLVSIQAVYTQSGTVYDTDSLDSLKSDLVVTAVHSGGTTETVTTYTLSGSLVEGTSTITVSYGGKTTTFNVTVTHALVLESISAVYTQSGTVYDTDSLDSLKDDLVVTATYDDSSTETIPNTDYTLSGTLTVGTSTITVAYGGKTTTFNVTVTANATWDIGDGFYIQNNGAIALTPASNSSRACYLDQSGEIPIKKDTGSSSFVDSSYYPIPIPTGATGIKANTSDTNVYFAVYALKRDTTLTTGWNRLSQIGWATTQTTLTFPTGSTHWAACIKHGNAGTASVTTSDTQKISLEFVY